MFQSLGFHFPMTSVLILFLLEWVLAVTAQFFCQAHPLRARFSHVHQVDKWRCPVAAAVGISLAIEVIGYSHLFSLLSNGSIV